MESVSETQEGRRRQDLEARLQELEQKKSSLESEISVLVEQIPILEMSRYAALLESGNHSLSLVRDMLRTLAEGKPALEHDNAGSPAPRTRT
jgi:predicted  nucleic acid-binding Zn-ribbon protein